MGLLPTKKSIPKQKPTEFMKLIYGEHGIGKTPFVVQEPNTVLVMGEDGSAGLSVFPVNIREEARKRNKHPWIIFLETVKELLTTSHNFENVAIDTVDRLYEDCFDYICEVNNFEHPSDEGYGKGWEKLNKEFKKPFRDYK